jgi:hypothetical protein
MTLGVVVGAASDSKMDVDEDEEKTMKEKKEKEKKGDIGDAVAAFLDQATTAGKEATYLS